MRFCTITFLLLAGLLAVCSAKPIPIAKLNDIERRWAQGESEVGCVPSLPNCYLMAWIRSLSRSSIHAAHSHRDATPAWPVARDPLEEVSWDERSAAVRKQKRKAPAATVSKMKAFVANFYRKKGMEHKATLVNDVPVLKPKRGMKYPVAA